MACGILFGGEPIERSCARQEPIQSPLPLAGPPLFVPTTALLARFFKFLRRKSPPFDARSPLVQRTLTVLTSTKPPVLGHHASRSLCTAKNPQHHQVDGGSSCGTCQGNRTVKNSMLLIAASHTHVLFISTLTGATLAPVAASQVFYSPPMCGRGGHSAIPRGFGV